MLSVTMTMKENVSLLEQRNTHRDNVTFVMSQGKKKTILYLAEFTMSGRGKTFRRNLDDDEFQPDNYLLSPEYHPQVPSYRRFVCQPTHPRQAHLLGQQQQLQQQQYFDELTDDFPNTLNEYSGRLRVISLGRYLVIR